MYVVSYELPGISILSIHDHSIGEIQYFCMVLLIRSLFVDEGSLPKL